MCVYSMIVDHYGDKWQRYLNPDPTPPSAPIPAVYIPVTLPTAEEIEEFRTLLEKAREYDKKNSEPECELEEKKERLRKLAKELGVEIGFL